MNEKRKNMIASPPKFLPDGRRVDPKGQTLALSLLRITVGMVFTVHGAMKLANPQEAASQFASFGIPGAEIAVYLAICGELLGGLGLLFGLLTRLAAWGPLLTMGTAIAFVHAGNGLLAANQGWEYPLTLMMASLFFVFRGAGPWSADALIRKMRTGPRGEEGDASSAGLRERTARDEEGMHRMPHAS